MPDAFHLLAVSLDRLVRSLAREELGKRVHFVSFVEILSLLEFNLNHLLVKLSLERICEP